MRFLQLIFICINIKIKWEYIVRNSLTLSTTDFWFLKVFKFLQCYHQVFIVFHYLGCWNELASDWHQLFKVFSKEFLFFCYFWKLDDFKHAFGTSRNSPWYLNIQVTLNDYSLISCVGGGLWNLIPDGKDVTESNFYLQRFCTNFGDCKCIKAQISLKKDK